MLLMQIEKGTTAISSDRKDLSYLRLMRSDFDAFLRLKSQICMPWEPCLRFFSPFEASFAESADVIAPFIPVCQKWKQLGGAHLHKCWLHAPVNSLACNTQVSSAAWCFQLLFI